jgi:uncharacterized protein (DUF736 family)
MKRREFMIGGTANAVPDTPRNRVALAANEVSAAWEKWAASWNAMMREGPDTVSATEPELWEEYKALVREVDKKRTAWIRGFIK